MSKLIKYLIIILTTIFLPITSLYANEDKLDKFIKEVKSFPGYYPIVIRNNMNNSQIQKLYLFWLAKLDKTTPCVLTFTKKHTLTSKNNEFVAYHGKCIAVTSDMDTSSDQYNLDLMSLTSYHKNTTDVLFYIPETIGGRTYVSPNHKLPFPIVKTPTKDYPDAVSYSEPSVTNPSLFEYNLIFDKFEFTYTNNTLWIDPTAVDFFSLPITLVLGDDKTKATGVPITYVKKRHDIINDIMYEINLKDVYPKGDKKNHVWPRLQIKDASQKTDTTVRIAAPYNAINKLAVMGEDFPLNTYLSGTPFNYLANLITYYAQKDKTLIIDASEVASFENEMVQAYKVKPSDLTKTAADTKDYYTFTGTIKGNQFVFSNNPPDKQSDKQLNKKETKNSKEKVHPPFILSIDLSDSKAVSAGFFMPGQPPLQTPDKTIYSVLVKNMVGAFSVGLLPTNQGDILSNHYWQTQVKANTYYKPNSHKPFKDNDKYGPWYNLYAKAIHMKIPNIYAYAFDDLLEQSGTIQSSDNTTPVTVILRDMSGTAIPEPLVNAYAVKNVQFTSSNICTQGQTCQFSASWEVPSAQNPNVQYYILPADSATPLKTIIKGQTFVDYQQTSQTVSFKNPGSKIVSNFIEVFSCIPGNKNFACPNSSNNYTAGVNVPSAESTPTGMTLLPVTNVKVISSGCTSQSCTLNARWDIPNGQPQGAKYYINPISTGTGASMADVIDGQTLTNKNSSSWHYTPSSSAKFTPPTKAQIMTCADNPAAGLKCPDASNQYDTSKVVGSIAVTISN